MQFKQLISVLCLCVMAVLGGCTPYMVIHDLGDDSIQEYIKPAKGLEGGFVDRWIPPPAPAHRLPTT